MKFNKNSIIRVPYSKKTKQILDALYREGYIRYYLIKKGYIDCHTKSKSIYLQNVSKPSKRVYLSFKQINKLNSIYLISTPKGIFSNNEIKLHKRDGGELLYRIKCQN